MMRDRAKAELERRAWMRRLIDEGKPIPAQPYFGRGLLDLSHEELRALAREDAMSPIRTTGRGPRLGSMAF